MKKTFILSLIVAFTLNAGASIPARECVGKLAPRANLMAAQAGETSEIVSAYINIDPDKFSVADFEALGGEVTMALDDILTVRIPVDALMSISNLEGVKYVQTATQAEPMLDIARPEIGAQKVQSGMGGLKSRYTGKGVVVGIVDSGFDYGHAAFKDATGLLRIKRVWEQQATPKQGQHSPDGFGYGLEMTEPDEILEAKGDIWGNSHGTHVTSLAAGSDVTGEGELLGMAPDADIVLVSMYVAGASNVNISNAIAYIFRYAAEVGKPCVVNLSLGSQDGPHDGTSTFDVIADRLQGPGRLIVGASGNNRADKIHLGRVFSDNIDETPLRSFIDFKSSVSSKGSIEVWGDKNLSFELAVLVIKTSTGEVAERVVAYAGSTVDEKAGTASLDLGRNVSGTIDVAWEESPLNGKPHVVLNTALSSIRTGYALALEVRGKSGGRVDLWACDGNLAFTSRGTDGYVEPTDEGTICEIGGTGHRILTVGAYVTRSHYTIFGEQNERSLDETDGDLGSFSSCGPTADGRVKPNVTAPGCFIRGAVNNNDNSGTIILSSFHNDGARDHMYGFMQGTSMATPIVTGVVATWLQIWPDMTPEQLADVVAITARTDSFTGDLATPDSHWGAGKINALQGALECENRVLGSIDIVSPDALSSSAPIEYFNLQGMPVTNPSHGIYIKIQGSKATKVVL